MTLLTWNPAWETGFRLIDEQHRQMLAQFESLLIAIHENRPEERVHGLLTFLSDYVETHFSTEEDQMKATHYPEFDAHKAVHDDMRAQVARLVAEYPADSSIMSDEALIFMTDWLIGHINVHDRRMASHLMRFNR